MSGISTRARERARDLLDFIDASPSPWHAVDTAAARLRAADFRELAEADAWTLAPGERGFVVRGGSSLIAFVAGTVPAEQGGLRIVGAHTDSPGLRLKPRPAIEGEGLLRVAVEVYGGPILASFADRDLGLAGRVAVRDGAGHAMRLLRTGAVARLPNLAIHLNRDVNENGLKFNKQTELPLLLGGLTAGATPGQSFVEFLADRLGVDADDIVTWELGAYDTQAGDFWGAGEEFIADGQLDNLSSCHAGLAALVAAPPNDAASVLALFDHEEVGSESAAGAAGSFVTDVVERLAGSGEARQRALARSFFISADMAHAAHPNFPNVYEPGHRLAVNGGPAIKRNANQRYASGADGAARFMAMCDAAGIPWQEYAHRGDLACGSTIGPLVAARLGIAAVDIGAPMWAMHSARESAGVADHDYLIEAFRQFFR